MTKGMKMRFILIVLRMLMQIYCKLIGHTSDMDKAQKLYEDVLKEYKGG